jgi:hypothetical protein
MTAQAGKPPETLFAALAAFQASLPKIAKGETGKVEGLTKQGKPFSYTYKYADLADVSAEALPRLGAVGLAFIALPTTRDDGRFGLAYSLVHVSGGREDGFYELHVNGLTPQQVGGLITYARRYCLCAATGIAPAGDDNDAAEAEAATRRSAGDVFENAAPARPQQAGSGAASGQDSRPDRRAQRMDAVPADDPWYTDEPAKPAEPRTDDAWADSINAKIDKIASKEDGNFVWAQVLAGFNDGRCTPGDKQALLGMVAAKVSAVMNQAGATAGEPAEGDAA